MKVLHTGLSLLAMAGLFGCNVDPLGATAQPPARAGFSLAATAGAGSAYRFPVEWGITDCNGNFLQLTAEIHVASPQSGALGAGHYNLHGTVTGLDGTQYQLVDVHTQSSHETVDGNTVLEVEEITRLIGQGTSSNQLLQFKVHVTFDSQGNILSADYPVARAYCQ